MKVDRPRATYAWVYWGVIFCNCVAVQALWLKSWRTSATRLFLVACVIQLGMWSERFMLIITSLHRDFLPSSWRMYSPTWVDLSLFAGTIGLFGCCFLLFLRFVPSVSATEVKELAHELGEEHGAPGHDQGLDEARP